MDKETAEELALLMVALSQAELMAQKYNDEVRALRRRIIETLRASDRKNQQ